MLVPFAILLTALLVGAASIQLAIAIAFWSRFAKTRPVDCPVASTTSAAVILSVRGSDPSLANCLDALLRQDHQNYQIHVVIDHQTDHAYSQIQEIQRDHIQGKRLLMHLMTPPPTTCSLKCHCLIQAVAGLGETDYVAFIDADVTPHTGWLSDLLAPLNDPHIGGVTGAQWFEPRDGAGSGGWLRSTWNGGAMIPTIHFANPWAGSFAMRHRDLLRSGLIDQWRVAIVDDGPIRECIGSLGLAVVFAPGCIMVNRESCSVGYALRWTTRMLTWSRLYEPTFFLSVIHAAFSNFVMIANLLLAGSAIAGWLSGPSPSSQVAALWSLGGLLTSGLLCVLAYVVARRCVQHSEALRGAEPRLRSISPARCWKVLLSVVPSHLMYGIACMRALCIRDITWRGIQYRVAGKAEIERLDYQPFVPVAHDPENSL